MLLWAPPVLSPAKLVQYVKARSSQHLQAEFPELRKRLSARLARLFSGNAKRRGNWRLLRSGPDGGFGRRSGSSGSEERYVSPNSANGVWATFSPRKRRAVLTVRGGWQIRRPCISHCPMLTSTRSGFRDQLSVGSSTNRTAVRTRTYGGVGGEESRGSLLSRLTRLTFSAPCLAVGLSIEWYTRPRSRITGRQQTRLESRVPLLWSKDSRDTTRGR
jgi:hypothetical protein